jgi:hypothetical protein
MSLRTDAFELLATLKEVLEALRRFEHPNQVPYATEMIARLEPAVADIEHAIDEARDKDAAVVALDVIGPLMHNINGAATNGDLRIFPGHDNHTLDTYWRLNTIFRESRYAAESL